MVGGEEFLTLARRFRCVWAGGGQRTDVNGISTVWGNSRAGSNIAALTRLLGCGLGTRDVARAVRGDSPVCGAGGGQRADVRRTVNVPVLAITRFL